MILYGDLEKVEPLEDGSIRVHGVASTGARDAVGERVTPDAMRAALPDYLAFGAIREMHAPRAAGAALWAEVDAGGITRISAHIVDPVAVTKVKAGVYKGLSIGGKVLARDPADATVITALRLDEISLVDRPCNPEAVIDLWKAQAPASIAPSNEAVRREAEAMARHAGRPGRRNDYVVAARAKLAGQLTPTTPPASPNAEAAVQADIAAPPDAQGMGRRQAPATASPTASPTSDDLVKLAGLQDALATARAEVERLTKVVADAEPERDALAKRLADQAAEIERLRALPLPPRTAGSHLAKAVAKDADGAREPPPVSPDQFARAIEALPVAERAHMLMKAALARPVPLSA